MEKFDDYRKLRFSSLLNNGNKKFKNNKQEVQLLKIERFKIHKKRLRKRGFNQAEKIADNLSKIINIPVIDCIGRRYNTRRLYKLGKEDRVNELKNAFIIKNNIMNLKNKNVLLVDDIFTTGSTVNEISKVLKINGVNKIVVATFLTRADTSYTTM